MIVAAVLALCPLSSAAEPSYGGSLESRVHLGSGCSNDVAACEFFEIRGNIQRVFNTAMHAPDTACREHTDAGHCGDDHRGGDGRRSVLLANDDERQITTTALDNVCALLAEAINLLIGQPNFQAALQNGDRGGYGTAVTNRVFDKSGRFDVSD